MIMFLSRRRHINLNHDCDDENVFYLMRRPITFVKIMMSQMNKLHFLNKNRKSGVTVNFFEQLLFLRRLVDILHYKGNLLKIKIPSQNNYRKSRLGVLYNLMYCYDLTFNI